MQNVFPRVEGSQCKSLHTIRCKTPSGISLPLYPHSTESTRPAAGFRRTRKYSRLVLSDPGPNYSGSSDWFGCTLFNDEVSRWLVSEYREYHHNHHHHCSRHHFTIIFVIVIITVTRPKPAYGRQGLAGLWGQDTDQAGTFWGVVNISLGAFSAQLG